MTPKAQALRLNQGIFLAELRDLVVGLRHYLEEEKSLGFAGWPRSPGRPAPHRSSPQPSSRPSPPAGLEAVREELGDCRRCKLHSTRTHIVFGSGNPQAKLVFVGEGPGREEDLQGEPFVGQAGQLLTKIIQAIRLQRAEVYIANIIKCRPPENRNPEPDEISACEPFLIKQIEAIRPRLICALGTFAAQTLLKTDEKISLLRGKFHPYQGIPLMPTYHPAFLLRNPNHKREVWEDMKKIKKEYDRL
jgi:uracil-DNA glycosylase family 4